MQAVTPRTNSAKGRAPVQIPDLLSILTRLKPALIADLDKPQLAALVAEAALVHIRRPKDILRQGEPADWIYLIIKGRIEVRTWDRAEIRIAGTRGDGTKALLVEGDASDLRVRIEYPESGWFSARPRLSRRRRR